MPPHTPVGKATKKGIYRPDPVSGATASDEEQRVAEFSYQNDALADLIVQLWNDTPGNGGLWDRLLTGSEGNRSANAKKELDDRGVHIKKPIVIQEDEYYQGYTMTDNNGVVFVLPKGDRVDASAGHSVLEAAKLLMACTPNGI
jgi:hypothetical protein